MIPLMNPKPYDLYLHSTPARTSASRPFRAENVTEDVRGLILQTYMRGVLSGDLPLEQAAPVRVEFRPAGSGRSPSSRALKSSLWPQRRVELPPDLSQRAVAPPGGSRGQLRAEGQLGEKQVAYQLLVAVAANGRSDELQPPVLIHRSKNERGRRPGCGGWASGS